MVNDLFQILNPLPEGLFPIFLVIETSVFQPCQQHSFIASGDNLDVLSRPIAHGQKSVQKLAVFLRHREIALLIPHGSDDHLLGKRQISRIKTAGKDRGIFHQVVDFIQQIIFYERPAAQLPGFGHEAPLNCLPPLLHICQHIACPELFQVLTGFCQGYRALTPKAMSPAEPVAVHSCPGEIHNLGAPQRSQPAHRPGKSLRSFPPAHGVGKREAIYEPEEQIRQQGARLLASELPLRIQVDAGFGLAPLQSFHRHSLAFGKAKGCLGWIPLFIESNP